MQAVWYDSNGAAKDVLQVGEMPDPAPGPGEVLVRLVASGINPVDVKRRRGARGPAQEVRTIPHFDGAGVVEAVGEGVRPSRVGERVWIYEGHWQRRFGTAAEYIAIAADRAVRLPDETGFAEGACLGIPAMTAHRAVFADGPVEGQTVLVTGGAGSVGSYAVQFAKLGGARVISTVSGDAKAARARSFGADETVNYKAEDAAARLLDLTGGAGVDRVVEVEFGGNLAVTEKVLKENGVVAAYASDAALEPSLPFYRLLYKNLTIRLVLVFGMPEAAKRQAVRDITHWLEAGRLRHPLGPRFPLAEAAHAHEAVEAGAGGHVVLEVGP